MSATSSIKFRERALRLYLENRQKVILPALVQPRTHVYFWATIGLLAVAAGLVCSVRLPMHVAGRGVFTEGGAASTGLGTPTLVILLPPASLSQLAAGQALEVRTSAGSESTARVSRVEPHILSPDATRETFGLGCSAGALVTEPVAVAIAELPSSFGGLPSRVHLGGVLQVRIRVGERSLLDELSRAETSAMGGER